MLTIHYNSIPSSVDECTYEEVDSILEAQQLICENSGKFLIEPIKIIGFEYIFK